MKASIYVIIGISILIAGLAVYTVLPSDPDESTKPEMPVPSDPQIISAPVASNVIVGQTVTESVLKGEFSVPGTLRFVNDYTPDRPDTLEMTWEFTPSDTTNYNKITGTVTINVFEFKLIFEENGGFEIDDIYFNGTYTLAERPLTAKNEYRFDDWSRIGYLTYITYPYVVYGTTELYAQYTYHTPEKIRYGQIYNVDNAYASALWGKNGIPEWPAGHRPFDPPIAGSISGEVVVADMYDGLFVTAILDFGHTNITKIVFPNYIEYVGSFIQCRSLGPELIIPNTVKGISDSAFDNCWELKRVEFQDGDGFIEIGSNTFFRSGLEEITLNRVTKIPMWGFASCKIQTITIPADVTVIYLGAFSGSSLREVIWEAGSKLERVEAIAFDGCAYLDYLYIPESASIAPDAFKHSKYLENIDITDAQIDQIAKELHEAYIGPADDFKVNIERNAICSGMNYKGNYVANTEEVNLKFEKFSIYILDALIHEFFHHYQYVLAYGVGEEDLNSVPYHVVKYSYYSVYPENKQVIIANKQKLHDESDPSQGYEYEWLVNSHIVSGTPFVLVDEAMLDIWRQPYIPLLPDESNWNAYWDQQFESDARGFASWFSGLVW